MNKKNNNKGFTLAELLIVVAIIAVLVAIAIPVFNSQLEKSREATDAANIRNAYAETMVTILDDPASVSATPHASVGFKQAQAGWQNGEVESNLQALAGSGNADGDLNVVVTGTPAAHGSATFGYTAGGSGTNPTLTITIG